MEVKYRMTASEIIGVIFYKLPRTFGFIVSIGGVFGIVANNIIRMNGSSLSVQEKLVMLAISIVIVSLIPAVFGFLVLTISQYKSQHGFLRTKHERKLSISKSGMINTIANKTTQAKWTEVSNVNQNRNYIFIHLSENLAFAIPKHSFDSEDGAKSFYVNAHQFWKNAKTT
jgi:hypothetical protein